MYSSGRQNTCHQPAVVGSASKFKLLWGCRYFMRDRIALGMVISIVRVHFTWLTLGRMYIVLSDETERRLRLAVVTVFGGKKGDLSGAIEQAVKDWLRRHASERNISRWVKGQLTSPSAKVKRRKKRWTSISKPARSQYVLIWQIQ